MVLKLFLTTSVYICKLHVYYLQSDQNRSTLYLFALSV